MARTSTTLILSAWEPEIAPLRAWLTRQTARAIARAVRCLPVGVGAVDAGIGAAHAIAEVRPARVIFVGTAGSYAITSATLPVGAVALPEEIVLCSTAALRGDGYLPAPMIQRLPVAAALHADLRRAAPDATAGGVAATTLAITRTLVLARRIARATGAVAENLEVFAVARAAARADAPFAAVLGIANRVGPRAHIEWRRHHEAASKAACEAVWACLRDT